jgi:hypothetical protein
MGALGAGVPLHLTEIALVVVFATALTAQVRLP